MNVFYLKRLKDQAYKTSLRQTGNKFCKKKDLCVFQMPSGPQSLTLPGNETGYQV